MRFFLPVIFFIIFFIILLSPQPVNAANVWICGTVGGVEACTNYNTDTGACDRSPGFVSDLSLCQIVTGSSYSNTCCRSGSGCTGSDNSSLNIWDWNYANGCIVTFSGGLCTATWQYQTQTCGATDTCYSGAPTLNPGLCSDTGCSVSSAPYKTCCYADTGLLDGSCTGERFSGSCPGGTVTVMCGVSQSTCDAIAPLFCSTAACGSPACADEFPQATPPPEESPPPPTPPPSSPPPGCPPMTCSYSELNSVCPTGIQIVTGTGCDGVNCGGCTYVGGCSAINCEPTGGCNWNGVQDNGETGIDCGGGGCPDCPGGGGGGGSGVADFDVKLRVWNETRDGPAPNWADWQGIPDQWRTTVTARPGDILIYAMWYQNWSDRVVSWFKLYENFLVANGAPNSLWDATVDESAVPFGYSPNWWWFDNDFTVPYSDLRPGDPPPGRGMNGYAIEDSEMSYTEIKVAFFRVTVKDAASLGSICSFGQKSYAQYDGGIYGNPPPQPYESCVNSKGTTDSGYWDEVVNCNWWWGSNDVVVNIPEQCATPCNNSTPPNNRMYVCYFEPGTRIPTLPPQPADSGGSALAQGLEPSGNLPSGTSLVGTATAVDQNWVGGEVDGTNKWDDVTAIWKGRINFQAGTYTFYVGTDDGNTLTIKDGPEGTINLSSNWTYGAYYDPEASTSYTFSTAGWRTVIFKYFEGPGAAAARLRWVFTPPPTPAPAWIQVTGDVHSNTRINAPGGP